MAAPDIPTAKRAGLPVDLERLRAEGDAWLQPNDRYALKTWGLCVQAQPGVFMVRVRVPGGVLPSHQARGLARLSRRYGPDWLHLTTRQNVELHWVEARTAPDLLDELAGYGLSTRSACGHTLRNVMCSELAGSALDEPFDCLPDARAVSDAILARSDELNVTLPSRINISFGGSPRCREDALINDAGFVSTVVDGVAGYEVWAGGSLGKAPALSVRLSAFVPRVEVLAAAEALVEVFVAHGDFETPSKARMKFLVESMGEAGFRAAWDQAFEGRRGVPRPELADVEVLDEVDGVAVLARRPPGGWSVGVQPQRAPGLAIVTVDVPLGDLTGNELELLAELADLHADGHLTLTRDQNVSLRDVPLGAVPAVRAALQRSGLHLLSESHVASVRACTGSSVCALGITESPELGRRLLESPGLGRNSAVRVHISGCPNSCAQTQSGDIGLSGTKMRKDGATVFGYHLHLGADLGRHVVGEVVGRVADADVPEAVEVVIGTWEAVRHAGETLAATVHRVGHDAFAAQLEARLPERWATGPEPEPAVDPPAAVGAPVAAPSPGPSGEPTTAAPPAPTAVAITDPR